MAITKQEALAYLKCDEEEDWEDAFDELLFAVKQNLISKPLLYKTVQTKIKQLQQLDQVIQAMTTQREVNQMDLFPNQIFDQTEIYLWWKAYAAFRNEWKLKVSIANQPTNILQLIETGLQFETNFSKQISGYNWTDQTPIIGVESDAMMIHNQLLEARNKGWFTFEELFSHKNELSSELLLALKRLSLLHTYTIQ